MIKRFDMRFENHKRSIRDKFHKQIAPWQQSVNADPRKYFQNNCDSSWNAYHIAMLGVRLPCVHEIKNGNRICEQIMPCTWSHSKSHELHCYRQVWWSFNTLLLQDNWQKISDSSSVQLRSANIQSITKLCFCKCSCVFVRMSGEWLYIIIAWDVST